MIKKALTATVLSLFAMTAAMPGLVRAADAEFEGMDRDKDGKVSQEEFLRWYPVKVWKKADADGDGYVQETEWIPVREGLSQYKRQTARDAEVKK